jgi:hypothetical protein
LIGFILLPPYAQEGYKRHEIDSVIRETLGNVVIYRLVDMRWPSALLHIATVGIMVLIAVRGETAEMAFDLYASISYLMIAVGQGIGRSERYGWAVLTGNIVAVLLVATLWIWECRVRRNRFTEPINRRRLWTLPFAVWAFWSPMEPLSLDPSYLLFGYYGVAFCLTTPVLLTPLILFYPEVNKPTMRVTAFVGLIFSIFNVLSPLLYGWDPWVGTVLHTPLLVICAYALLLSRR